MNEKVELSQLEKKILYFIDKETWEINRPKTEMRPTKSGNHQILPHRIKIRWMNIRWENQNKKRFVDDDLIFNKSLNILKIKKLITSKTKCQLLAGLSCTKTGHNLLISKS